MRIKYCQSIAILLQIRENAPTRGVMQPAVLKLIGKTPMIKLDGIWVKCEWRNPSGSIKDRVAIHMLGHAEAQGLVKPGMTLVEATSGNMGNALALVGAAKGYNTLVIMPKGFSQERVAISKALGAQVRFVGDFHLTEAINEAKTLGKQPGFFCLSQFDNVQNIVENRTVMGKEILAQLQGVEVDAVVQGVGTGGTLIGVAQALLAEERTKPLQVVAVEPEESQTLKKGLTGVHQIEGIADGFVPPLFAMHRDLVNEIKAVPSSEAIDAMRILARRFGLFVGPSSGANWIAAQAVRKTLGPNAQVLTFFCDEGEKYLHRYYLD